MLEAKTPIGRIEVSAWEEKELNQLSDSELIERAVSENTNFCISPATYAMIEKRFLCRVLQQRINPNVGMNHLTLKLVNNW